MNGWKSRLKRVGIVGGTGYTGIELLRMLASHRGVEVSCLTSRSEAGRSVASLYPWLSHYGSLHFEDHSIDALSACDLVFYATPNKIAMNEASSFLDRSVRVIDLAADFRFSERSLWESVYGGPHGAPQLTQEAFMGYLRNIEQRLPGLAWSETPVVIQQPQCSH